MSKETIALHRTRVERWQAPSELLHYTDALMDEVGSVELFANPQLGFVTEAWAAAKFADLIEAETQKAACTKNT